MEIKFEKWHGAMNDFIVIHQPIIEKDILLGSLRRQAKRLCGRHTGIGADGILALWTHPGEVDPRVLSIVNSDGSLAANCGNGLRCATGSILRRLEIENMSSRHKPVGKSNARAPTKGAPLERDTFILEVEGQSMICRQLGKIGSSFFIGVEMPTPLVNEELNWWNAGKSELVLIAAAVARENPHYKGLSYEAGGVEVGNQHIVVVSDQMDRVWALKVGEGLQKCQLWDGVNVHGVKPEIMTDKDQSRAGQEVGGPLSSLYRAWVWERGAGETMACGSGAVAIAVERLALGLEDRQEWIGVDMPGGRLYVKQDSPESSPILAGPAEFVFSGSLEL